MSTDQSTAYSYCFGGTGKKVKFCCRDLLAELNSVQRMFAGEQFAAAMQLLDRLIAAGKERPCLFAWRGLILRKMKKWDELAANAERFLATHPENRVALAMMATVQASQDKGSEALNSLREALAKSDKDWEVQLFYAIVDVAMALANQKRWAPCRSLLSLWAELDDQDDTAPKMLSRLIRSAQVSLLLKQCFLPACPADAPWKALYDQLAESLERGFGWIAVDRFLELAGQHPDCQSVAGLLVSLWSALGDAQRCREAADRFAALSQCWEDAAEALAVAMLTGEDPLGDFVDLYEVEWTVNDPAKFESAMLEDCCVVSEPVDYPAYAGSESPPPKAVYRLLDRPPPVGEPSLENTPLQLAEVQYYGRQTDQPARLLIDAVPATTLGAVRESLHRIADGSLAAEPNTRVVGKRSASFLLLAPELFFSKTVSSRQRQALMHAQIRSAMVERWPDQPLGVLGGITPRCAAADPAKQLLVQAAIKVLESLLISECDIDFNDVRSVLGLPLAPPVEAVPDGWAYIPLIRLHRVVPDNFSAPDLAEMLQVALATNASVAVRKLALAIVQKPEAENTTASLVALAVLSQDCQDLEQQLDYIRKGRATSVHLGQSDHNWDLFELRNCLERRDGKRFGELIDHLATEHPFEPGVFENLEYYAALVQRARQRYQAGQQQQRSDSPAAAEQQERSEGLWVPGQPQSGGKKLWTPE